MKNTKVKKPIYKRVWFWVLAVIVVISIANGGEEEKVKESNDVSKETAAKVEPKQEVKEEPAEQVEVEPVEEVEAEPVEEEEVEEPTNDPGISLAEFEKIQNGMSYEEVVNIVGGEGKLQSETGEKGTQFYTVMYGFDGENGFGSNAVLMFQGGKLNSKSQFGLE